jgi:hypothetical protein
MTPSLSVVIVTDEYATTRLVVKCFAAQTISAQIELVLVILEQNSSQVPVHELTMFHSVKVEKIAAMRPMPAARAAGVRQATAPVVFIGETHSFPHPRFAEEIVEAHRESWDVVVPGLGNANPATAQSWAAFVLDYGYWLAGLSASTIPSGPTWNSSYKRDTLMALTDRLDTALSGGDELPQLLRARGSRIYFEPKARIDHTNVESKGWMDERFLSGVVVGADRRRRWSLLRRGVYVAAAPLIPFVLLHRARPAMQVLLKEGALPRGSLTAIAVAVTVRTIGEVLGYIAGLDEDAEHRMENYELHKLRFASRLAGAAAALA